MIKGSKHSEETKRKLSLRKGWKHTPEAIEKIREAGKRRLGMKFSNEHKRNISLSKLGRHRQEQSSQWKGDRVGYRALHYWIEKELGKPFKCDECGTDQVPEGKKRWFDWANVSGVYLRDINDWIRLCKPCHRIQEKTLKYAKDKTRFLNESNQG